MPYTPEQIQQRYDRLPPDIQEAIDSVSTTNTVVDIGQKYDLMYDQIEELVNEVGLVMVGLTPSPMFVSNIARRMQIDTGKAMLITQDINKEVFGKMRESLKKIEEDHGEDTEKFSDEGVNAVPEKPAAVPPPPQKPSSEETMQIAAEKAQKASVVSAVERAGGFVIDKPEQAPLRVEEMVHDELAKKLESRKNAMNDLEQRNAKPAAAAAKPTIADYSLGTSPGETKQTSLQDALSAQIDQITGEEQAKQGLSQPVQSLQTKLDQAKPMESIPQPISQTPLPSKPPHIESTPAEKEMVQESIVDTLLSKGVAMSLDSDPVKPAVKAKPYDGTDPYRETAK